MSIFVRSFFTIELMNLKLSLAIKHHPTALGKNGLMNSIVADAHSKTSSAKFVQKQPLCQRTLMPLMREPIISYTSMHSVLHEHLAVKKICSRWIPHNLTIAQTKVRVHWCKEMLEKYDRGASKDVYKIVTGD